MATAKKKKPKEKPVDDPQALPGLADCLPARFPKLDKCCEEYLSAQAAAGRAKLKEKERHAILIDEMKEREVAKYIHNDSGQVFQVEAVPKVKHRNLKEQKPNADKNGVNPDSDGSEGDDMDDTKETETIPG